MPLFHKFGVIFTLIIFKAEIKAGSIPPSEICGTVQTEAGKMVTLRDGVPPTLEEFGKVHATGNMKWAVVEPAWGCAVNICGASSWGDSADNYGGYEGCRLFKARTTLHNFYDNFNTSSLGCGCRQDNPQCSSSSCSSKSSRISWTGSQCAVLFQEENCSGCYLPPVSLTNDTSFVRNYTHQFIGLIVRKYCFVEHFAKESGPPIVYEEDTAWDSNSDHFVISYKSDPETFRCECGVSPPTTIVPSTSSSPKSTPTPSPNPAITDEEDPVTASSTAPVNLHTSSAPPPFFSSDKRNTVSLVIGVVVGGIVITFVGVSLAFFLRSRRLRKDNEGDDGYTVELNEVNNLAGRDDDGFTSVLKELKGKCTVDKFFERSRFQVGSLLGNGHFGVVYKSKWLPENDGLWEDAAIKVIPWRNCSKCIKDSFFREVKTYHRIEEGNANIVKFLGACCDEDGLYLLTEFCEGGSLEGALETMLATVRQRVPPPPPPQEVIDSKGYSIEVIQPVEEVKPRFLQDELVTVLRWCEEICSGMECLHSRGIFHGDLAPRNLLLKNGTIKIIDFGLSKDFFAQSLLEGDFPLHCMAPEFKNDPEGPKKITAHVDTWAFGCTAFQIFGGSLVRRGEPHPPPPLDPGYLHNLLLHCWAEVPERRPSFTVLWEYFREKKVVEENKMNSNCEYI